MKIIKKEIIDAIKFYNENTQSITKVAEKFNVERHTLSKYIKNEPLECFYNEKVDCYVYCDDFEKSIIDDYKTLKKRLTEEEMVQRYGITVRRLKNLCKYNNIKFIEYEYKNSFNRNAFKTIETEEDAYILGFMLADAYVCEQRGSVRIKLHSRDEDILHKINKYLNSNVKIKHEYHNVTKNKLSYLYLSSIELVETLKTYGICRNKSLKEKFYQNIPNELKKHYIRGLIDGDGFIRKNEKTPQIGLCGSFDVVSNVAIFLNEQLNLQIDVTNAVKHRETEKLYQIVFCGRKAIIVINFLYKDSKIYLDRKYELAKRFFWLLNFWMAVDKSSKIGRS